MTNPVSNTFSQIAKKYTQQASSSSEVNQVTTNTQNYVDQLTAQALNEVSADNPDYQVEDAGQKASEIMQGITQILGAANTCLQTVGKFGEGAEKSDGNEYKSKVADSYNKTLDKYNKNPEKYKEALLKDIGAAEQTSKGLTTEIAAIKKENAELEKVLNGDVSEALGNLKEGAKQAVDERNAAQETANTITTALNDIAGAIKDTEGNIIQVEGKTIEVTNLSDQEKELVGVKEGEIVEIKADETKTNETIQTLMTNFAAKNQECNDKQTEIDGLSTQVSQAQTTYSNAQQKYNTTPATVTVTEGSGDNARQVTKENPAKSQAKQAMDQAKQALDDLKAKQEKAQQEKAQLDAELKEIGSNIQVGNTTLDKIVEARSQAEAEKDAAQAKVDSYAVQLKGFIDESESLQKLADSLSGEQLEKFNAQSENDNLIDALVGSEEQFSKLTPDLEEAKVNAQSKLDANKKALVPKEADKAALDNFIQKANQAISANIKPAEAEPEQKVPTDKAAVDPNNNESLSNATVKGSAGTPAVVTPGVEDPNANGALIPDYLRNKPSSIVANPTA